MATQIHAGKRDMEVEVRVQVQIIVPLNGLIREPDS